MPPKSHTISTPKPVRKVIVAWKTVRLTEVLMPISVALRLTFWKVPRSRSSWANALTTRMPLRVSAVRSVSEDQTMLYWVKSRRMRCQKTAPQTISRGTGSRV